MRPTFPACLLLWLLTGLATLAQPLRISTPTSSTNGVSFSFPTIANRYYNVDWGTYAAPNIWWTLTNVKGNGTAALITDAQNPLARRFYRVFAEQPLRCLTVGHVGPTHARLAVGLDAGRDLGIVYSTDPNLSGLNGTFPVFAADDYTRSIDLTELQPQTRYYYNLVIDHRPQFSPPYPSFRTPSAYGTAGTVRFAFGSCLIGTSAGGNGTIALTALPSVNRIWQAIAARNPDFFVHLGDTAYCDNLGNYDLPSYREVHRDLLDGRLAYQNAYALFRREFPFYTILDDHEIINDWPWDPRVSAPSDPFYLQIGKQAFREYHGRGNPDPYIPGELYYSFQVGDIGCFMTDTRSFRSCQQGEDSLANVPSGSVQITFNGSTGTASSIAWNDGLGFTEGFVGRTLLLENGQRRHIRYRFSPSQILVSGAPISGTFSFTVLGKTLLGASQKQHLKNWLLENRDTLRVKFIGTPTPIHGLSEHVNGRDAWGTGYQAELNEILDFTISHQIRNVVFLSGDQHWAGSFNRRRGNVNFFEFMSSPLSSSFHPKYSGTNETLLARANWMFDATMNAGRVENFGLVTVRTDAFPMTVQFELFDAQGTRLNSTTLEEGPGGLDLEP